jgi:hypothetical protein
MSDNQSARLKIVPTYINMHKTQFNFLKCFTVMSNPASGKRVGGNRDVAGSEGEGLHEGKKWRVAKAQI